MRWLAFVVGLAVIIWVGAGYIDRSALALAMTVLIGVAYLCGVAELQRFAAQGKVLRQAVEKLSIEEEALTAERFQQWLEALPATLRQAVRLRLEGVHSGLPGPVLTPYLVGMLVLLGMLGTFLGMMITLDGAVLAIETTTELQRMRSALAAPVKGLGVAFGTSVAGVAASTMLGLMSALSRRQRLADAELLEQQLNGRLSRFTLVQQRRLAYEAMQQQATSLPQLVDSLHAMAADGERRLLALEQQLLDGQQRFHDSAQAASRALAVDVTNSLQDALSSSVDRSTASMTALVSELAASSSAEAVRVQQALGASLQAQVETVEQQLLGATTTIAGCWTEAVQQQQQTQQRLLSDLEASLHGFGASFKEQGAKLFAELEARLARMQEDSLMRDEQYRLAQQQLLQAASAELSSHWRDSSAANLQQQQEMAAHFAHRSRELVSAVQEQASANIARAGELLDEAAAAPRAAAELLARLDEQWSARIEREQNMLGESSRLIDGLASLLGRMEDSSRVQLEAVEQLALRSSATLEQLAASFAARIDAESGRLHERSAEVAGGAVEVASLAEAFGVAVEQFGAASAAMMKQLAAIEAALGQAIQRSDEQLAYYVAQARELIDLSLMSQQRLLAESQGGDEAAVPAQESVAQ